MQRVADIADKVRAKALFAKDEQVVIALLDKAEQDAQKAGYDKLLKFETGKWQDNIKKIMGN
ncbi:hypothetical protein D3C72_2529000 [compost metagenome]